MNYQSLTISELESFAYATQAPAAIAALATAGTLCTALEDHPDYEEAVSELWSEAERDGREDGADRLCTALHYRYGPLAQTLHDLFKRIHDNQRIDKDTYQMLTDGKAEDYALEIMAFLNHEV